MATPIARPSTSAPIIVGTGFSRRKNSVRSRAVDADCFVVCQVFDALLETRPAAERQRPSAAPSVLPVGEMPGLSRNSSPFGLIIAILVRSWAPVRAPFHRHLCFGYRRCNSDLMRG